MIVVSVWPHLKNTELCISVFVFQILACVFVFEMQQGFCWVIQLFSLVCTVKGYYDRKSFNNNTQSWVE